MSVRKAFLLLGIVGLFFSVFLLVMVWVDGEDAGMDGYINPIRDDGKIVMRYGFFIAQKRFDAARWFKDGMYRIRDKDSPSDTSMLRNSIPPIPDSRLEDLRASLAVAIGPNHPFAAYNAKN
jgi:hypothetical protein